MHSLQKNNLLFELWINVKNNNSKSGYTSKRPVKIVLRFKSNISRKKLSAAVLVSDFFFFL